MRNAQVICPKPQKPKGVKPINGLPFRQRPFRPGKAVRVGEGGWVSGLDFGFRVYIGFRV